MNLEPKSRKRECRDFGWNWVDMVDELLLFHCFGTDGEEHCATPPSSTGSPFGAQLDGAGQPPHDEKIGSKQEPDKL